MIAVNLYNPARESNKGQRGQAFIIDILADDCCPASARAGRFFLDFFMCGRKGEE
jgi:hypothetical protein